MAFFLVLPWLLGAAPAADNGPCDPAVACFDAAISLPSAVGDFYVDGALVAAGVNNTRITTTPDVPHTIEVRNMQDPGLAGYGSLFVYQDLTPRSRQLPAASGASFSIRASSTSGARCATSAGPSAYLPADVVDCRPDGGWRADAGCGPWRHGRLRLDPGPHTVRTDLGGDIGRNWSTKSATISR